MPFFEHFFYYPDSRDRGSPADEHVAYEDVTFTTSDGVSLHGWFLPAATRPAKGTVLHLHGNAANITGHWPFVGWLPAAGYNVLTFDYRGFGRSSGKITRDGTVLDAEAALDYLRTRPDVDGSRIVLFGQSIGATIASVIASRRRGQIAAVVMDSAFTSYRDIAAHHIYRNPAMLLIAWWFPFGVSKSLDAIDHVPLISPTPILFMHGKADRIVPTAMSQKLYIAAKDPKELWLIDGMDHMQVWEENLKEAGLRFNTFVQLAMPRQT